MASIIAPTSQGGDPAHVAKRLQQELMSMMMNADEGISAFPADDNLFAWRATISGSEDTAYQGLDFELAVNFPSNYPVSPPNIKFETPIFHPNVDLAGNICLDILQDMWSAALDVRTLLISLRSLLGEPNNASPLNNQAATLWDRQEEFRQAVLKRYNESKATQETVQAK